MEQKITTYGIFSWFGYELPLYERLKLINEAGFDSVMLWWGDEMSGTDGVKTAHPALARSFGLKVANVHAPYFGINDIWSENSEGAREENLLRQCLEDCADCEVPVMVTHITDSPVPPPFSACGLERIERLISRAGQLGVKLALENVQCPEYLDRVMQEVCPDGSTPRGLGFCYDSGHDFAVSHSNLLIDRYASLLCALHLHDNDGSFDQHLGPGQGNIPFEALLAGLAARGLRPTATFEPHTPGAYEAALAFAAGHPDFFSR